MTRREKMIFENNEAFAELIDIILDDDAKRLCQFLNIPENSTDLQINKALETYLDQKVDC